MLPKLFRRVGLGSKGGIPTQRQTGATHRSLTVPQVNGLCILLSSKLSVILTSVY